jgi:hypothetical protein
MGTEVEIENGKLVYTEDGCKAEYLGKVENGHVINVYGESYDHYGERYEEPMGLQVVSRVFATPPKALFDTRIAELKGEVAALEKRSRELSEETRAAQKERLDLAKKLAHLPALRHLDDFIEKRITHVLFGGADYKILPIDQAFAENGVYSRKGQKLLTLYGDVGGNLQWRLNQYSDGSGWTEDVTPCLSLEEAEATRMANILADLDIAMGDYADGRKYRITVTVKAADLYGVEVSPEQREAFVDAERERLIKERADVERNASTYGLKLTAIDAALSALPVSEPSP